MTDEIKRSYVVPNPISEAERFLQHFDEVSKNRRVSAVDIEKAASALNDSLGANFVDYNTTLQVLKASYNYTPGILTSTLTSIIVNDKLIKPKRWNGETGSIRHLIVAAAMIDKGEYAAMDYLEYRDPYILSDESMMLDTLIQNLTQKVRSGGEKI